MIICNCFNVFVRGGVVRVSVSSTSRLSVDIYLHASVTRFNTYTDMLHSLALQVSHTEHIPIRN
jgi:hypothetical protein